MHQRGINLHFSHSVEKLAEVLADKVQSQQAAQGVFRSVSVLVPNSNMQRYLQLQLAQLKGVCANLNFPFLETGLFQWLCQLHQKDFKHLSGSQLSIKIWQLLKVHAENPEFALIQEYLSTKQAKALEAAKTFQLSQKLAMLLLDYESQRPEMVLAWMSENSYFNHSSDDHLLLLEQTQMTLYKLLMNSDALGDDRTLFQAFQQFKKQPIPQTGDVIHLFTPSRISQLHRQIISYLAQFMQINIYQLDVCLEYWEDMQTKEEINWQEQRFKAIKNQAVILQDKHGSEVASSKGHEIFESIEPIADENPLLKAWGKPGREALKLFSELEHDAAHFEIYFNEFRLDDEEQSLDTLLGVLQHNILYRLESSQSITDVSQLNSLQLAVAPSIYREVEAVYNSILWNLKNDENLMLHEVAVLVTDMNAYRFVIEQVFEQLNRHNGMTLAYSIVDGKAETESSYAAAVLGLLELLEDDFIRSSVFRWLDNTCVQYANQISTSDWQDWLKVVDELGIYCGFEQLYPDGENDCSEPQVSHQSELFTWQMGLQKLRRSLVIDEGEEAVADILNAESIGQLCYLLESLHACRSMLQKKQTAVQWEVQLNQIFDMFIEVPTEQSREQMVQMSLQQSLSALSESAPDLQLNYDDVRQYIHHEIHQIPANKGNYLSGGVVCASLQPMRPIPFKVTYILGMDDKQFPGQFRKDTLDLTQRSRRIGDINSIENKNYLFLETMMCTRNKLYLSYVGSNLTTNETIEPSPVLVTLKEYCNDLISSELGFETMPVIKLPLMAYDDYSFDQNTMQFQDFQVNFSYLDYLINQLGQNNRLPDATNPIQQHWREVYDNQQSQIEFINAEKAQEVDEVIDIDISDLAGYLANPQSAILKKHGLKFKHEQDVSMLEKEPMELSHLDRHHIFTAAVKDWLKNSHGSGFGEQLGIHYQQALKRSQVPMPAFVDFKDFDQSEELLNAEIKPQLEGKSYLGEIKIGAAVTSQSAPIKLSHLTFELDSGQIVRVHGVAEHVYGLNDVLTDQLVISSSTRDQVSKWSTKLLKPFIQWCFWHVLDDVKVAESFAVHLIFPKKVFTVELRPWYGDGVSFATQSSMQNYLKHIIEDYVNQQQGYFLPFEKANQLTIASKGFDAQIIKLQAASSKAKNNSYLAYPIELLTAEDFDEIKTSYQKDLNWPEYEEIWQLFEVNESPNPADHYRRLLLPLYAMVFGQFKGDDGDLS